MAVIEICAKGRNRRRRGFGSSAFTASRRRLARTDSWPSSRQKQLPNKLQFSPQSTANLGDHRNPCDFVNAGLSCRLGVGFLSTMAALCQLIEGLSMRFATISSAFLVLSGGDESTLSADEPPSDWIDPATGHRTIRLSQDAGTASLYFHQNAYTDRGDKLFVTITASPPAPEPIRRLAKRRKLNQRVAGKGVVLFHRM